VIGQRAWLGERIIGEKLLRNGGSARLAERKPIARENGSGQGEYVKPTGSCMHDMTPLNAPGGSRRILNPRTGTLNYGSGIGAGQSRNSLLTDRSEDQKRTTLSANNSLGLEHGSKTVRI
jgi:hypothetical protein